MVTSLIHALALVFGTALYVYLFAVLSSQGRGAAAARVLLALVACSGLWYLGWLAVFYLRLTTGQGDSTLIAAITWLAHAGGWAAWPAGLAVAWFAWAQREIFFFWALLAAGAVSGIASGVWPLGSLQTVLATLPVPLLIIACLYRDQIFGLLLPRSALLAAVLGGAAAVYFLAVPLASTLIESRFGALPEGVRSILLLAGFIVFVPLYNSVLAYENRRAASRREWIREVARDASGLFDWDQRARYFEQRVQSHLKLKSVRIVQSDDPGPAHFTHRWPLESEGRAWGWLLVDATPRRRLDDDEPLLVSLSHEIAHSLSTLRLLDDKLGLERELLRQEHLASLGKVAAAVAHEIRNPLSAIKSITQVMLQDEGLQGPYERDLRYILSETDRLASSVKQLLGYSKPIEAMEAAVDVSALVMTTLSGLQRQAAGMNVHLLAQVEPGCRLLKSNSDLLSQILLNLVLNALQSSPPGGTVVVGLRREDSELLLTVTDCGPGVPPEMHERIFEPFFTTRAKGTGLGLSIVRKAAHHLHGEVRVESPVAEGRGARFLVTLPGAEHAS
ncbi:ATP-binding protein [uncultured Paludibaculum sp.]|uniref:sensor histidine kinase n=1 Tax=uncultured Paludibaculum sp. TaxID=1765020 RepID=UPI002AAB1995|nr:ATP-binding protein [uncultured Paludibaculum sp.]